MNTNKKILGIFVLVMFLFSGFGIVSADEDENEVETNLIPRPQLLQRDATSDQDRPENTPIQREIERKKTLRETYQDKLRSLFQKRESAEEQIEKRREELEDRRDGMENMIGERRVELEDRRDGMENMIGERRVELEDRRDGMENMIGERQEELEKKREDSQDRIKERKEEIEVKREEIKGKLEEKRRERVEASVKNVISRFEKYLEKITEIKDKTQERINDLGLKGIDMTEPTELIKVVPIKISEAELKINDLREILNIALDSETPQEAFQGAKDLSDSAKETIKEAHKSLVDVISSMKASVRLTEINKDEENADGNNDTDTNEDANVTEEENNTEN